MTGNAGAGLGWQGWWSAIRVPSAAHSLSPRYQAAWFTCSVALYSGFWTLKPWLGL